MNKTVCIVGLGYVGIPMLNAILTSTFYKVIAYDISETKIAELQAEKLPESLTRYSSIFEFADRVDFTTKIPGDVEKFHAFIICVPTPLTMDGSPKLDYVEIDDSDKQFIFINPNDPEYKKPDESLDSNTTHDFN